MQNKCLIRDLAVILVQMPEMDDMALVREYAERKSETAFETLVQRHVNMVYSTALRQVGDPHLAEEVAQATFIILAHKAASLGPGTILPVWLLKTARFAVMTEFRSTLRRRQRETEAHMDATMQQPLDDAGWEQIAPVLDDGLAQLNEKDRAVVVLRFFKQQSLQDVGTALGIETGAAQKRVWRALEKLRRFFAKRGVVISAAAITSGITAHAVQAAPAGLAVSVTTIAVSGSAIATSTITLVKGALKLMAWTKLKTASLGVAVIFAGAAATSVVLQRTAAPTSVANATEAKLYVNSLGMKFVSVPGTEVLFSIWHTRLRDFEVFVKETGYNATERMVSLRDGVWREHGDSWHSPGFPQTSDVPVCGVSWNDAQAFCKWLSNKEGKTYRLPTDAEWSHAVGIGEKETGATPANKDRMLPDVYLWGDSMSPMVNGKPMGNFAGAEANDVNWIPGDQYPVIAGFRDNYSRTSPVGSFPANELGLYDMMGNLQQWCEDWYDGRETFRVMRGASWFDNNPKDLLLSNRRQWIPEYRSGVYGFRVVLEPALK